LRPARAPVGGRTAARPLRGRGAGAAPVPEPMAPMKSATMVRAPMHMPPKAAAMGMYRLSSFFRDCTVSRCPCTPALRPRQKNG